MSSLSVEGLIQGLHHITLVTSNQEVNRRFYTEVLGLRRVKYTVNQDDIFHRHLFYADEKGTPGSSITFFEWPHLPNKKVGVGSPHHLAYSVRKLDSLPRWVSWLRSKAITVQGPLLRKDRISIYFRDPDGVLIEITSRNTENLSHEDATELRREPPAPSNITSDMKLVKLNHASPVATDPELTERFHEKFLGLKTSKTENPDDLDTSLVQVGTTENPSFLQYLASAKAPYGIVGIGAVHHIAMGVEDEKDQLRIMNRLDAAHIGNSGIVNRNWFKSLYFQDPEGNLLEVATKTPGYAVDERLEELGTRLVLPPWLEPRRKEIENRLHNLDKENEAKWPPKYPPSNPKPESLISGEVGQ